MKRNLLIVLAGALAGCGGPKVEAQVETPEEVPVAEPLPEVDPLPACPFDMQRIRDAAVGFNVAIQDEPESWLRLRSVLPGEGYDIAFEYEQRDEGGREVGFERYVCTPVGLALKSAESDGLVVHFEPPVLVLPVQVDSGQSVGEATLVAPDSAETRASYTHSFDATPAPPQEIDGEAVQIVSTIRFEGELEATLETATIWVIAEDFLAPLTRAQSRDGGPVRVESIRTFTR